jgi:hypothetical protein
MFCLSSSCVLCIVVSNTYCAVFYVLFVFVLCLVYSGIQHILCCVFCFVCLRLVSCVWWCPTHKTQDEDKQNKKHNTICVGHHYAQDTRRRQTKQKTQHNMCWTPPYTRHKAKTNKTKNTAQYVLDTTIHKTQDEDKQNIKHSTICVGYHYTQDTRRRQTKQKTQHNMCCTPLYISILERNDVWLIIDTVLILRELHKYHPHCTIDRIIPIIIVFINR